MKRFALCTAKYQENLQCFIESAEAKRIIYIKNRTANGYEIILAKEAFCEALLHFLMDIAEGQNPMYAHSAKLRRMARQLRRAPVFAQELAALGEFIAAERELNIEGYVTFRMEDFRGKLDLMMYRLVKKIKFGNGH